MKALRRFLPRFYVEGFVDPEEHVEGSPAVWVHRPVIGMFQPAPVEPGGTNRHFNEVDEPALRENEDLEPLLAATEDEAARLVGRSSRRELRSPRPSASSLPRSSP